MTDTGAIEPTRTQAEQIAQFVVRATCDDLKQHDHQVKHVQRLIQEANALESVDSRWHTQLTRVRDALGEHVREEEEQIFPRIEQIWDASRREEAGQQIEQLHL